MIRPEWNTPPDGDFARYVERLSAQAALPKRDAVEGEHGLDVGMTSSSDPKSAQAARAEAVAADRRLVQSNGAVRPDGNASAQGIFKVAGIVWAGALLLLLASGVSLAIVIGVFVAGLWLAHRFRRWLLPAGTANWQQWLQDMARRQQQQRGDK